MVDQTIAELAPILGKRAACAALRRSRATYYRWHPQGPPPPRQPRARTPQPRALSETEREEVLGLLHEERFVDQAPATIYATLLDEGRYLCSVPTMYRVLRAEDEVDLLPPLRDHRYLHPLRSGLAAGSARDG